MEDLTYKQAAGVTGLKGDPRYSVPWRIVIVYIKKGVRETFRGSIADVSISGVLVYSEVSIYSPDPVVVTIEIPAYADNRKNIIVGAKCRILYSVLSSSKYGNHRVVLQFIEFDRSGEKDLKNALATRTAIGENKNNFL